MSKELKKNVWHAVFVGIGSGAVIGAYALLPLENPLFWAVFITLPTVFMFGGAWSDVVPLSANALFGLAMGWSCFQLLFAMTAAGMGYVAALVISVVAVTVVLQTVTAGFLGASFGRCPMAFVGLIACFAAGGENLAVAAVSLVVGVLAATCFARSGVWAAKLAGTDSSEA